MATNKRVKVDDIAESINAFMLLYVEATDEVVKEAVKEISTETAEKLKVSAKTPRRTGDYAADWTTTPPKTARKHKTTAIVYNAKHYRLTHLLEHGHVLWQGGSTKAHEHIASVEIEETEKYLIELKTKWRT